MIEAIAAVSAILGLIAVLLSVRGHRAWAADTKLTEIVVTNAAKQVGVELRKDSGRWVRVLEVVGDRAMYALRFDTPDERVSARAILTRHSDGSVAISTRLLARSE